MKTPKKTLAATFGISPVMEVWSQDWRFLGTVPDRGTEASLSEARQRFGAEAYFVLPALVEVGS